MTLLKYLLILPLLFLSVSQGKTLQDVLSSDAFYRFQQVELESLPFKPSSFNFIQTEGFDEAVRMIDRSDAQVRKQAGAQIALRMPIQLVEYAYSQGYGLEFHFGATRETLYFLQKSGLKQAILLHALSPMQPEYVVVEPLPNEAGRLIVTNFYDEASMLRLQSLLYAFSPADQVLDATRVKSYDFHMVGKSEYRSAYYKEAIFTLPVDVRQAVLDGGNGLFVRMMARKFAQMSVQFLRGLYGDQFIGGLSKVMKDEGMDVSSLQDQRFEALLLSGAAPLQAAEMAEFVRFQNLVSQILVKHPESSLTQLLLVGHELAIDKEPLRKQEILRRFTMTDVNPDFGAQAIQFLPVRTARRQARVLIASGVRGESSEVMMQVLHKLGIRDFNFLGRSTLLNPKALDAEGLLNPVKIQKSAGQIRVLSSNSLDDGTPAPVVIRQGAGLLQVSPLLAVGQRSQILAKSFDFLDESVWYVSRAAEELKIGGLGVLNTLQYQDKVSEAAVEQLVDILMRKLGVEDILPFATDRDFGFSSVEEKLADYSRRMGLDPEKHRWFMNALRRQIEVILTDAAAKQQWLNSFEMSLPGSRYLIFEKFLQSPFQNDEVLAHLSRIQQGLRELHLYLGLMGEDPEQMTINVHGDFVYASMTPVSPLVISLTGLGQNSLVRLLRSPFGSFSPGRPLLLQVIPVQSETEQVVSLNFTEAMNDLGKVYADRVQTLAKSSENPMAYSVQQWVRSWENFRSMVLDSFFEKKSKVFRYSYAPGAEAVEAEGKRLQDEFLANGLVQLRDGGQALLKEMGTGPAISAEQALLVKTLEELERFGTLYLSW